MKAPSPTAIGEIIYGGVQIQDIYVSRLKNVEARLRSTEDVIYAHGSPLGFRNMMNDKRNHRQLRNETMVVAKLARSITDEVSGNTKSQLRGIPNKLAGFTWPLTDFNNFIIGALTKKPIRPKPMHSIITDFRFHTKSNLTIAHSSTIH